ncbi:MAG: hypothetical protein ABI867_37635 [Kofleriaceae bacterium]
MRFVLIGLLAWAGCEHGKGGGTPTVDGGVGKACGGIGGDIACPGDQFCDFPTNLCGGADEQGVCRNRPTSCDDNFDPVCACNNQTFSNECDANASGFDVNSFGSCPVEAGKFACGFRSCELGTQFCQEDGSDIGGEPSGFSCMPIPSCPGHEGCDCLASTGTTCASLQCEGDDATGLTVTCPGG